MNGNRSTGAPTPPHSLCHCCFRDTSRSSCVVAAARRRLLFDWGLDSRQQWAAWAGNRYRVSQSKKYRPIPDPPQYRPVSANTRYPNTSIVRTLVETNWWNWICHVYGTSFWCLVCKTWTKFLVTSFWYQKIGSCVVGLRVGVERKIVLSYFYEYTLNDKWLHHSSFFGYMLLSTLPHSTNKLCTT